MKRLFHSATAITGLVVALMCAPSASAAAYDAYQDFGSPGQDNVYERVIMISPNARWVNVNRDEIIKFVDASSGRSFVWYFNTRASTVDLSKVAPAGILAGRPVIAYIAISHRDIGRSQ